MELPHPLPDFDESPPELEHSPLEIVAADEPTDADDEPDEPVAQPAATSDPLRLYVRQIGDGPLLTREEERELARRKDQGDEAAKRKLIE